MTHGASRASRAARRFVAVLAVALACCSAAPAQTAKPVRVLSSNGVRAPLEVLEAQCERAIGRPVTVEYGTSASIRQRISAGENVDVAFVTNTVVAELAKAGHVASSSITPLGRGGIGVGIRAGGQRFAIDTPEAIKRALLAADSVTFAREGASRPHIERMFEQLGIASEMQAKTRLEAGSVQAAEKVVAGEAEILLTLVSEILPVPGMELVGPLPSGFQSYISFDGALGAHPTDQAAARAFLDCVAAPAAAPTFAAKGIER